MTNKTGLMVADQNSKQISNRQFWNWLRRARNRSRCC